MKWPHVDLGQRLGTIPGTKNGSEHKVPLSPAALAVFESIKARGSTGSLCSRLQEGAGR